MKFTYMVHLDPDKVFDHHKMLHSLYHRICSAMEFVAKSSVDFGMQPIYFRQSMATNRTVHLARINRHLNWPIDRIQLDSIDINLALKISIFVNHIYALKMVCIHKNYADSIYLLLKMPSLLLPHQSVRFGIRVYPSYIHLQRK